MTQMFPLRPEMDPATEARFYELLKPILERTRGRVSYEKLRQEHFDGIIQVWAILDPQEPAGISSIGITRIIEYDTGERVMRCDNGAGKLEDAIAIMPVVEQFARAQGCHRLRIEGRRGWQKIFPEWEEVSRIIEKDLTDGWRR